MAVRINPNNKHTTSVNAANLFITVPPYLPLEIIRERLIAVVVACTILITLNRIEVSIPNCCAILGTSLAASMMPIPKSIFSGKVNSPKYRSVVYINAVKHVAMTCFIHCVNPSV